MRTTVATETMGTLPITRLAARIALSLAIAAAFLFLLRDRIGHIDTGLVTAELGLIPPLAWGMALAATAISFWAVGQYDVTLHRHLATGIAPAEARRAGIAAIAVSQTIGAGVITGALLRWRCIKGVSLWQATLLSGATALSFLAGWAVVTSLVLMIQPATSLTPIAALVLTLATALALLAAIQPTRLQRLHLPNLLTLSRILCLTIIDTFGAALALWLLLPIDIAFITLLPAFLLALGAGLVSGAPGGVGVFEVTLLTLLPHTPDTPLLAAVLGWRIVSFVLPALIGAAIAAYGPACTALGAALALHPTSPAGTETLLATAPRAELALVRQGHLSLAEGPRGAWLLGRTPHTLTALFGPIGPATLQDLILQAQSESRFPAIYKASPRTAAMARRIGWHIAALGAEAVLIPQTFTPNGPAHATLRRKLRKADAVGIQINHLPPKGAAELAAIARLWQRDRRERGFSMGQCDAAYLATQRIYVARLAGRITAFISLHDGAQEWTLDLMQHAPDAPDGTMHALIAHAITDARARNIPRLSLAAAGAPRALPRLLRERADKSAAGLLRFKHSFAPQWQPLYLCAPSRTALLIAAAEITRAIHWPAPLLQDHHAQYGFAPTARPWQRKAVTEI